MKDLLNRLIHSIPGAGRDRATSRDVPEGDDRRGVRLQALGRLPRDPEAARRVVEARREQHGEHHPDYAAALSHLGTLLYESGDHPSAEPLLRQAVTIRKAALGAAHPEVSADLRTLEAILQARSLPTTPVAVDQAPATAPNPVPLPADASDTALEQLGRGPREIAAEARGLAETFARVGAALANSAKGMQHGFPPHFPLLNDAAICHNTFATIHDEAVRRADAVDLAPPQGALLALGDLAALMDRVAQLEDDRARNAAARVKALGVLDRVLALRHRVASGSALIMPCHEAASRLRAPLADARVRDGLPDDAFRLADGSHPLAALLRLAEADPTLSDDEWSRLRVSVVDAFGRPLAAAAARGRLVRSPL